ncbi:putative NIT2-nitrilase [Gorgonomyces haynaldii]|nr:putative NIT2-nitrilase [Gorgonomyces haynaldii]
MLCAVGQICSTPSIVENLQVCVSLIQKASARGARVLFLPEASDYIADSHQANSLAQTLDDSFVTEIRKACAEHKVWVSIGVHEKVIGQDRSYNAHLLIDDLGSIQSIYRKIHLFDVEIPNGPILKESQRTMPGKHIVPPISTPIGRIGLGVCYDLRFPEFATLLRQKGADILTFPSAFTVKTGMAHWDVLLRARAIENQTFVVAAAQAGQHTPSRQSYGNACIIDPWGVIIAKCSDTFPSLAIADIDLDYLERVRQSMPVLEHRPSIYSIIERVD